MWKRKGGRMKRAVLFGAGENAPEVLRYINGRHVKVAAIVDNDKDKWGKSVDGVKVYGPSILKKADFDYVLIASSAYWEEIKMQLKEMRIKNTLPVYSSQLGTDEKRIFSRCINWRGKFILWRRSFLARQEFYPTLFGAIVNPYYFARKGLLECIEGNRDYISGRCLDFGCGVKPYERLFQTTEYVGVEIESEKKRPGIVYYDGKTLPFADGHFDCAICSQVFEHIPNLEEVVAELSRVIKPGGRFILTVPFTYPEHLAPSDFRRFTSYGAKLLMEENGFDVIKSQKTGGFMEALAQMGNVYWSEKLFGGKRARLIKAAGVCFINWKGLALSKLCREDKSLYLDAVIVARKR